MTDTPASAARDGAPHPPGQAAPDVSAAGGTGPRAVPPAARLEDGSPAEALPILVAPHAALRAKARPVSEADRDTLRALLPRMFRTMYDAPGIGLAAPQVGVGLRVVVIDLGTDETPDPKVLLNPELSAVADTWFSREEGCLSLPGLYADVARPGPVTVRYRDENFVTRTIEAEGLLAACLQHEIDHLDGVLFVDHLSPLKRNMMMRKLAKERRQKSVA